jgi:hypothetical protein
MKKTMILVVIAALAFTSAASVFAADQNQGLRNRATAPAKPQALQTPGPVQKHAAKKWGRKLNATTSAATMTPASGGLAGKRQHQPAIAAAPAKPATTANAVIDKDKDGSKKSMLAASAPVPHCTKGKVCGHSCIAMDKVCPK